MKLSSRPRVTTIIWLLCICNIWFPSCKQHSNYNEQDGLAVFNKDSLAKHIIILASDSFQGRRPFTIGETRTVDYLINSFENIGLEPGNGSSYYQEVPLVEITPASDPAMTVENAKGSFELNKMDDYVIWSKNTDSVVSLNNDEVVFAGCGVVAPEYKWNDYANVDVKGKVVLVLVNDPGFGTNDTTIFKGKTMTYYGRWTYKYEEAARQGAKGCLIIHNTEAASYPFSVIQNSRGKSQQHLDTRSNPQYTCPVEGWITEEAAKKMLIAANQDTLLLNKARESNFKSIPLDLKLSTSMRINAVHNKSKNVIAKISGNKRPDEYIIYSAHWDHFGIGKPDEKGDSIYNGAADNASGTAAILEIARAFKIMKIKPERTIVFLFVTAEEQGLLGSAWYAQHPVFPLEKTVANINIDVINTFGKTRDMEVPGLGQSDLEDYLSEELKYKGRYIGRETTPEGGHYYRSDHFNFAKAGVPALSPNGGTDNIKKGKEYGEKTKEEYTSKRYHKPSDEYDAQTWNLDGGLEDIMLLFQIGKRLSFETNWPKWKESSEFKKIRDISNDERK